MNSNEEAFLRPIKMEFAKHLLQLLAVIEGSV